MMLIVLGARRRQATETPSASRDRPGRRHRLRIAEVLLASALAASCAGPVKVVTPLPADVRVIAPSAAVPHGVAAFSGTWAGRYTYREAATQEIALVVERIQRVGAGYRGFAIFSWGSMQSVQPPLYAAYHRYEVTISEDGVLRLRDRDLALHTFRVSSDETLSAEQEDSRVAGYSKVFGVLWRVTPSSL